MPAKIALSMIVKDDTEEDRLKQCLESIAPHVDKIFITGTKNPQTRIKKLVKKYGGEWNFFPWEKDFAKARNFALNSVPKEYDWVFWCDADDIVVGGEKFREAIDLAEKNNIKAIFCRYLYQVELDEQGRIKNILIEHLRERLIRNDGTFEWVGRIHETLIEKVPSGKTDYQGFYVVHLTQYDDMLESMWRNIEILEDEVMDKPHDPRPIYYLAKAYFDTREPLLIYDPAGEGMDSITMELLKDYLRKSGWAEERAQAWEYLSMLHRERNEYKKAIVCLLEALAEWPQTPSTYIQLALSYVMLRDWSKAMHWVKMAGGVEIPKTTLVVNPKDYKTMILEALFLIYFNTGKLEECYKVAQDLVTILPTELNQTRFAEITDLKRRNDIAHYVVKLAHHLNETGQVEQLKALINSVPKEIAGEPVMVDLRNQFSPPRTWGEKEIAIYCGPGFEQWSPKSVAKGIGGSEEAVIYLSRELGSLGWKVTVFADPGDDAGEHDGVTYRPYSDINWHDNFNIFISWRQIQVFDLPIKAKKSYLWNHDIQNAMTYTKERVDRITKVMFLSKWHREMMGPVPVLPDEKIFYTGNGINV